MLHWQCGPSRQQAPRGRGRGGAACLAAVRGGIGGDLKATAARSRPPPRPHFWIWEGAGL